MVDTKFAQLNKVQLEKISELERSIGVILVAYDISSLQSNENGYTSISQENHSS